MNRLQILPNLTLDIPPNTRTRNPRPQFIFPRLFIPLRQHKILRNVLQQHFQRPVPHLNQIRLNTQNSVCKDIRTTIGGGRGCLKGEVVGISGAEELENHFEKLAAGGEHDWLHVENFVPVECEEGLPLGYARGVGGFEF